MNTESTNQFSSDTDQPECSMKHHSSTDDYNEPDTMTEEHHGKSQWKKLPQLLRWIGGISLITSAVTFLLGGWMDAEPVYRYYSFFAFTGILAAAGIYCGSKLREDKGARTFLALSASFLPAHFCQLGAMIYAEFMGSASAFPSHYSLLQFDPIGVPWLTATVVIAVLMLTAFAYLGFSALARLESTRLTLVYLISNSLLLIPIRESSIVAMIGFLMLAFLIAMDVKFFSRQAALKSWDGIAMRSLLFAPFGLLLGRSLLLHDSSSLIASLLYTSVAGVFFLGLPRCIANSRTKCLLQSFSLIPMFFAWVSFLDAFISLSSIGTESFALIIAIPFAVIVALVSFYSYGSGRNYRRFAAITALGVTVFQLLTIGGVQASVICLIVSVIVAASAFIMQEKGLLYMGIVGVTVSIIHHMHYAIELYQQNLWLSLALTGTVAILASSYIEQNWRRVTGCGRIIKERLHTWN